MWMHYNNLVVIINRWNCNSLWSVNLIIYHNYGNTHLFYHEICVFTTFTVKLEI